MRCRVMNVCVSSRQKYFLYYVIIICCSFSSFLSFSFDKKRMKILMVVPSFPKIHDICMLNQMTGLIDRGHDVYINASKLGDTTTMQEDVITYNLLSKTIVGDLPRNLNTYDIVVFQLGHKAVNIKKTRGYKGKVVICLRGYDITAFVRENPHAYDEFFESCDLFMPVCEVFKKKIESLGCDSSKVQVHYSGIDCSRFTFRVREFPTQGTLNIVSAGRFVEKKGLIYAIKAIAQLLKTYPRIRYTIIGDGVLKSVYRRFINRAGLSKQIIIDGWHPHDEYIALLDKAHIFILPSVTADNDDQEGIPNVLKEAMAMGLMVVATHHSGNSELIQDKISGFLVSERNSMAIAKAVTYLLENPQEWESIQRVAHYLVNKNFDTEIVNNKLEKIFLNLISN